MNLETAALAFSALLLKILPLYALMVAGFFFGRINPAGLQSLARLQIYLVIPVFFLLSLPNLGLTGRDFLLPLVCFLMAACVAVLVFWLTRPRWNDKTPFMLTYACSGGNVGYYGIPVALAVLPPKSSALFITAVVGVMAFGDTVGYYLMARGRLTVQQGLIRALRLPIFWGMAAGLILGAVGYRLPALAAGITRDFQGCFSLLGAILVGASLAQLKTVHLDRRLLGAALAGKFLLWPAVAGAIIAVDYFWVQMLPPASYIALFLVSLVPLPGNLVAYAADLGVHEDVAGGLVFASTLVALIVIPLALAFTL